MDDGLYYRLKKGGKIMQNLQQMAIQLINNAMKNGANPQSLSPFMQGGIEALHKNDSTSGERIANQILQQAGITREQAMQIAHQRGLI